MTKTTVFLVDDHAVLRDGIAELIGKIEGFATCGSAGDGSEFLKRLEKGDKPDVVLLDLNMPELNGYQVADVLSKKYPEIKILVLTMDINKLKLPGLIGAGVKGILNKDSSREELAAALKAVANGEQYFSQVIVGDLADILLKKQQGINLDARDFTADDIRFMKLCASDLTYNQIGAEMKVPKHILETLRMKLWSVFDVKSRVGLAIKALQSGIIHS